MHSESFWEGGGGAAENGRFNNLTCASFASSGLLSLLKCEYVQFILITTMFYVIVSEIGAHQPVA